MGIERIIISMERWKTSDNLCHNSEEDAIRHEEKIRYFKNTLLYPEHYHNVFLKQDVLD